MSRAAAFAAVVSAIALAGFSQSPGSERERIEAAIDDYALALYRVEPDRIRRSVSPELVKYGTFPRADGTRVWAAMTYDQLVDLAANWNAGGRVPRDSPHEVELLHVGSDIASARVTATWGMDYLLLMRDGSDWKIRQVLWERVTPTPSPAVAPTPAPTR